MTTPFVLAACEADAGPYADEPATVIETIGDTTIVRTLSGSVWGAEVTLVPEVSIGELDGPDEYLFGWITWIAADDDLDVYAFDFQAQHVQVYDSLGTYVETLGRPGEGPGEFNRAEAIAMLPDNRLVVRNPLPVCPPSTGSIWPGTTACSESNAGTSLSAVPPAPKSPAPGIAPSLQAPPPQPTLPSPLRWSDTSASCSWACRGWSS